MIANRQLQNSTSTAAAAECKIAEEDTKPLGSGPTVM